MSHLTDVTRGMLPFLAWEIESRGRDSWGATDGTSISKHLGPITHTFWDNMEEILSWDRCILHTRAASCGAVTIPNAHPYSFQHDDVEGNMIRRVVGIHNGIVVNHIALDNKYNRDFEVDSMHIYAHIAEHLDMGDIHGWGNIAWYEFDKDYPEGALRVLRFNNDALHIAKLVTGELVFCSTRDTILRAAAMAGSDVKKFYTTTEETVYRFGKDKSSEWQVFIRDPKMRFGYRTEPIQRHFPVHNSITYPRTSDHRAGRPINLATLNFENRRNNICMINGCTKKVSTTRRTALVCDDDWKKIMIDAGRMVGV